jgi:hypothetical protein
MRLLNGDELEATAALVARWIDEADRIVIGAGSGLSAAAGFDFGDQADFAARRSSSGASRPPTR